MIPPRSASFNPGATAHHVFLAGAYRVCADTLPRTAKFCSISNVPPTECGTLQERSARDYSKHPPDCSHPPDYGQLISEIQPTGEVFDGMCEGLEIMFPQHEQCQMVF